MRGRSRDARTQTLADKTGDLWIALGRRAFPNDFDSRPASVRPRDHFEALAQARRAEQEAAHARMRATAAQRDAGTVRGASFRSGRWSNRSPHTPLPRRTRQAAACRLEPATTNRQAACPRAWYTPASRHPASLPSSPGPRSLVPSFPRSLVLSPPPHLVPSALSKLATTLKTRLARDPPQAASRARPLNPAKLGAVVSMMNGPSAVRPSAGRPAAASPPAAKPARDPTLGKLFGWT